MTELTAEKIEGWRAVWNDHYVGNTTFDGARTELNALCDLALQALKDEREGKDTKRYWWGESDPRWRFQR